MRRQRLWQAGEIGAMHDKCLRTKTSRAQARQLVRHGHILVNGKKVNIPSFTVKPNDVVEVREKSKDNSAILAARDATAHAFVARADAPGKYLADLPALARLRLARIGVARIAGGDACTVTQRERFYSYRRDRVTGRMAAMIWLAD